MLIAHNKPSLILLCLVLSISWAHAANIEIQGDEPQHFSGILGDKNDYHFTVNEGQSVVVAISQPNADVAVVLAKIDEGNIAPLYTLNTSADTGLNELLYITADDCTHCQLSILPQDNIDQSGSYQLSYQKNHNVDLSVKAIMHFATKAASAWQHANNDHIQFRQYLETALGYYQQAIDLAESEGHADLLTRNLYHAAQVAHLLSDYPTQERYLRTVLTHLQDSYSPLLLRAKYELAITTRIKRQLDLALDEYQAVLQLAKEQNDKLIEANALADIARIHYEKRHYQQALKYDFAALALFESLVSWQNILRTQLSIGITYEGQGEIGKAITQYLQVIAFANASQASKHLVDAYIKLATVYRKSGDIETANHYIDLALKDSDKFPHSLLDGRAKQQKALIFMVLGQLDYAADLFDESYLAYQAVNSTTDMINIEYFLSIIHTKLENYSTALGYASHVLDNDKKTGVKYDIGTAYQRLSAIYLGLQDYPQAMRLQELALEYLADTENATLSGTMFAQAAEIYFHNGYVEKGLDYFSQSREAHRQGKNHFGVIDTEYRFARMQALYGEPALALKTLQNIVPMVEQQQQRISRADQRQNYLAQQQELASLYVEVLEQLAESDEKMLVISEQFRQQALQAKTQDLIETPVMDADYAGQQQALFNQLRTQAVDYQTLSSPVQRELIAKKARHLSSQLQQLDADWKNKQSLTHNTKPLVTTTKLDIDQIQSLLAHNELILYFDTGKQQSHLWAISSSAIQHIMLPDEGTIADEVSEVLLNIAAQPDLKSTHRQTKQLPALNTLSLTLLGQLNIEWQAYQQILVIPDGPLHSMPFSVLTAAKSGITLLETHAIAYLPSLGTYQHLNQFANHIHTGDKLLLLANPAMHPSDGSSSTPVEQERGGFQASELPYSQYEAEAIENIFNQNATILVKDQASKQVLLSQTIEHFDIVHFATHGISHSYSPALAGLVLSNLASNNNLLLAPEISHLSIPAKLVVLSGCETAKGQLINGEGLMGLSRAFFAAGAKSVVASLWSVQDKATAELMKQFYHYLLIDQLPVNQALQQAKLAVRNFRKKNGHIPWRDPYYWAGFVLQGKGSNNLKT